MDEVLNLNGLLISPSYICWLTKVIVGLAKLLDFNQESGVVKVYNGDMY